METTFENARVGDRVWEVELGWGEVRRIGSFFPQILVHFSGTTNSPIVCYGFDGRRNPECHRTLFWDEIKITPPPRPKMKVKKEVDVTVHFGEGDCLMAVRGQGNISQLERVTKGKLTYEIEE